MTSEGELKKRMLYGGRTFIDLYYDREARLKELMEHNVECHPDPLMDSFVSTEKVHSWLDEARKEIFEAIDQHIETLVNFWKETTHTDKKEMSQYYIDAYQCIQHNIKEHDVFKLKKLFGDADQ